MPTCKHCPEFSTNLPFPERNTATNSIFNKNVFFYQMQFFEFAVFFNSTYLRRYAYTFITCFNEETLTYAIALFPFCMFFFNNIIAVFCYDLFIS